MAVRCNLVEVYYGRPWPAVYETFVQITHQIQVLTKPYAVLRLFFMRCRTRSRVPNIVG